MFVRLNRLLDEKWQASKSKLDIFDGWMFSLTYPTVVRVIKPHQKESRKDQEPAGLSFSAK